VPPCVLQLEADTLVAAVDTLLELELLYRVNADVDAIALEAVDDVELRQLLDVIELALDANGRPEEPGDIARGDLARRGDTVRCLSFHLWSGARNAVGLYIEGGEYRLGASRLGAVLMEEEDTFEEGLNCCCCCLGRRPLFHVDDDNDTSSPSCFVLNCAIPDGGCCGEGAFKPISRFVTLLAFTDIDRVVSKEAVSSKVDTAAAVVAGGRS
jgi:hypothetical protein